MEFTLCNTIYTYLDLKYKTLGLKAVGVLCNCALVSLLFHLLTRDFDKLVLKSRNYLVIIF